MIQHSSDTLTYAAIFDNIDGADGAIRRLRAAGFSDDELAVICPAKYQRHFRHELTHTETPSPRPGEALATGGAVGATLGGLALAAAVLTGGIGLAAAGVFIGGGAIAGGFSYLIVSDGYQKEADDEYRHAVQSGQIVVGVEVPNGHGPERIANAQRILAESGGKQANP